MGVMALLFVIVALMIFRYTMHLWVQPEINLAKEKELAAQWETLNTHSDSSVHHKAGSGSPVTGTSELFSFDPNSVQAADLKKLGLSQKTIAIFLNWRKKGKHFYAKQDFKELYTLSEAEYKRLAPYIAIQQHKINLNTADSITLVALPGIGAKLAHKILDYKKEIGRYQSVDQLMDVYHFDDNTMNTLKERLSTD